MLTKEKRNLTNIGKQEQFGTIFEKLTIQNELTYFEKSYILANAILFLKHYEKDNRFTSYADISYYIFLKYSIKYRDYRPLYDFSSNFGFFPIIKALLQEELYDDDKLVDYIIKLRLEEFRTPKNYIATLEQNIQSINFLEDVSKEKAYLAPTSFGKSSIIIDYINKNLEENSKVAIIVPTKSLLMQTYQMVRDAHLNRRIIIHDEMYNGEHTFIAVFTQERALRLMSKSNVVFDILIIDEAHNLMKNDSGNRQILLSRLIARNLSKNPEHKIIYLSPLVENTSNLRISDSQEIKMHKIHFNIKEPDIYELTIDNKRYQYNRFVNQFYLLESSVPNKFNYIIRNSLSKNFLYENSPRKIEQLAQEFSLHLSLIESNPEINSLTDVLKTEVHKDFFGIKYLKYGLIYLHGKLPDIIKEYLESKFRTLKEIKYLIANTVILEGINLPIDSLFILNTYRLKGKELTNLIGRINRLNDIFNSDELDLNKLLPKVHFINNRDYSNGHNSKIKLLRGRVFDDQVENPLLESFDDSSLNPDQKLKTDEIINNEDLLFKEAVTEEEKIEQYFIESGINYFYSDTEAAINAFLKIKGQIENNGLSEWNDINTIEKVNRAFIENLNVSDFEFDRLKYPQARNYYQNYIFNLRKLSFNERVNNHVSYFEELATEPNSQNRLLYVGQTYGETAYDQTNPNSMDNYIDLGSKTPEEIVNLAIVKLKMEDDFVSFKLNRFVVMLYDFDLISTNEYHNFIYGTEDAKKIAMTKSGLTISLITKLENDDQLKNVEFDEFNNLVANDEFKIYLTQINDLNRYELSKYIN